MEREEAEQLLAFVPVPAEGHLVAAVELAKVVLSLSNTTASHRFAVAIIVITPPVPNPKLSSFISSISVPNLSFLHLPPLAPESIPPHASLATLLDLCTPLVRSAIQTLPSSTPVAALVLDFFCSNMIDLALELGIPPYVFFTSSASFLGFLLYYPTAVDPSIPDGKKVVEMEGETIPFPGFASKLPFWAFPDVFSFGKNETYQMFVDIGLRLPKATGFLVNSFDALQRGPIKALEDGLYLPGQPNPSVHNVGPLLSLKPEPSHECIRWLDMQPRGSVVFLCFGSRGNFPDAQVRDIAIGLERSGHRFLWVVRAPAEHEFLGTLGDAVLDELLPDGFVGRTKERGLVWPSFAPQAEILAHEAVGGFVTHCGWNSCLESLWFGVPMAAWPLYAEQHLNAFEMVKEMGVAVEVRIDKLGGNRATAEEVERVVRVLMGEDGGAVRKKVTELKEEARKAVEVGGSSHSSMGAVAEIWSAGRKKI